MIDFVCNFHTKYLKRVFILCDSMADLVSSDAIAFSSQGIGVHPSTYWLTSGTLIVRG